MKKIVGTRAFPEAVDNLFDKVERELEQQKKTGSAALVQKLDANVQKKKC
jgi:hypothetical protein